MFREIGDERAFDGILNQIIENIQNGSLKAGAALPAERTMAETMGVSRPAVREVLRALELLGIVKPVPGGGNYITENIVSGTRDYIMKKNNSAREVDDQHHRLVEAIINGDAEQAERCMSEHMDTIERYMEEMQKKA